MLQLGPDWRPEVLVPVLVGLAVVAAVAEVLVVVGAVAADAVAAVEDEVVAGVAVEAAAAVTQCSPLHLHE